MNKEALEHRPPLQSMADTLVEPEFWYGNFQSWQRELLPIRFLFVASKYLRERGSRESKPVAAP